LQLVRRFGGGLQVKLQQKLVSVLAWISLGYGLGLSDQSFVLHYPWGEMRRPLFGYLAKGLLPEEFSVKVKMLGGRLRPVVG
jgi:hypothetical protein